jgi:hypothetical protein
MKQVEVLDDVQVAFCPSVETDFSKNFESNHKKKQILVGTTTKTVCSLSW